MRRLVVLVLAWAFTGCGRPPAPATSTFDPDSVPDAFATASGALWQAGATRAFQCEPGGDLYNGSWHVRLSPSCDGAAAAPPARYAAEDRWLPVIHWRRANGAVRWEFDAAPCTLPPPADSVLVVSLLVTARNGSGAPAEAVFEATFDEGVTRAAFLAPDVDSFPPGTRPGWGSGGVARPLLGWCENASGERVHRAWRLAAGGSASVRLVLPAYPTHGGTLDRVARERSQAQVEADARRAATGEIARGTAFELGDPGLEQALRGAIRVLLCARERRGADWLPTGGPFQYHDVWLRDGARQIAALSVAGFTPESRALARGLYVYQWPDGPFVSQRGQLDGTGQALWALAQAELRPAADTAAGRAALAALAAARWLERARSLGRTSGWPRGTLLPFGDPRDNERVRAQLVGNDAWMLAGLEAGERLARAAGRPGDAATLASLRAAHRADFARALERAGGPDIPASWQGAGDDWGNLATLWPCRAIAPEDPRVPRLLRRVWARSGGAGLTTYGSRDTLHGYVGADLGVWALLTGHPEQADSVLSALLRWRDATGGGAELFARDGGFGGNLPPHPTSAAALVLLARSMLVYDDADSLHLTLGARPAWWRGARVTRAPTRWGSLDLAFERTGERAHWKWSALGVPVVLHLPPGTRLAAPPSSPLVASADGRAVVAPAGTTEASITIAERTP